MYIDQKTLQDLSIFHKSGGVFALINHCTTIGGSDWLKRYVQQPPSSHAVLLSYQDAVKYWYENTDKWYADVNNGTILIVDKFFTSSETITAKPTAFSLFIDKLVRNLIPKNEQSLLKFSITQVMQLIKGCNYLVDAHLQEDTPLLLRELLQEMQTIISHQLMQQMVKAPIESPYKVLLTLSYYTRKELKSSIRKLVHLYEKIDGIRSMAIATKVNGWTFPTLVPKEKVRFQMENLYHPLLQNATSYSVSFDQKKNFLFLTGANMSGKSTLIRSIGIATYLAHLGIGIPATAGTISYMEGLITNMQIEDNIYTGESYFFAEVQRIKNTAEQLSKQDYNLVLMDELFKGTNVHDAYECTHAVIEALCENNRNIMALSTHLYELGDQFLSHPKLQFKYCETIVNPNGSFEFTYQLIAGISNDRIGYLVLKNEGVLDILNNTKNAIAKD